MNPKILKQALIEIIAMETKRPNATVKRMVARAKLALREAKPKYKSR